MKLNFRIILLFLLVFFIYLGVATKFTFKPIWALDYFNPLASSLLSGRLDIPDPGTTYDLVSFKGKWYLPWGILPSLVLMPVRLIKNQFIPTIYLTVFFSSANLVIVYLLLQRIKKEFFQNIKMYEILLLLALFAFGTTHFYVGTLGSVWHVDQILTSFLGTLGIYIIFKRKRSLKDYLLSSFLFNLALIGRATIFLLIVLPGFLYLWDYFLSKKYSWKQILVSFKTGLVIFGIPFVVFSGWFFFYNYARFQNPFEYGYRYIQESPYLQQIRETTGITSIRYLSTNLWYMVFEIPRLTLDTKITLDFNLKGNSIFFLTPPFLAIFLAIPFAKRKGKIVIDPYIAALWLTGIITIIPSLLIYSTGWMQFGYRYSLDITVILLVLSVFGMKGRLNILYILGIGFSVAMYWMGIQALM